jgi:hypothetical protein
MLAVGANPPLKTVVTRVPDDDRLDAFGIAIRSYWAVSVVQAIITHLQGGSALDNPAEVTAHKPVLARISPVATTAVWHEKEAQLSA